jgi:glycosyltransferase involved in cell wall biosynthesis
MGSRILDMQLSVIICTHNPRSTYMGRTIEGLKAQTLPLDRWELLLVDNASKSPVSELWDLSWHPRGRHTREDQVGLTPARLRGINEARGELLVFVDDDNVLDADFLEKAAAVASAHPFLQVIGAGVLKPEFEVPPSREIIPRLALLALREVTQPLWGNNIQDFECTPWGAGLCVKRSTAQAYVQLVGQLRVTSLLDRSGTRLFCGGDDLFSWVSAANGGGFGVFPELRITHLISERRVTQSYLLQLIHDHSFSHGVLRYIWQGSAPKVSDLFSVPKLLLHGIRNGLFSMRCQRASLRGSGCAKSFIMNNRLRPIKSM